MSQFGVQEVDSDGHAIVGKRVRLSFKGRVKRTKDSFREQCDINHIMARYLRSGNVDHLAKHGGQFGFAPALDFQTAMQQVRAAEEKFLDLPSAIRKRFGNDPAAFLEFAQNPKNLDALREMGLAKPKAKPEAPGAPPASGAPSGAPSS